VLGTSVGDLARQRAALEQHGYLLLGQRDAPDDLINGLGRPGEPVLLHPAERDRARRWSLSGTFGQDTFPWHTDGAISSCPPRWLVLRPVRLSEPTATELMSPSNDLRERLGRTVLLAKDRVGRARYLPALVLTKDGYRLRWDPRTCRSRSTAVTQDVAQAMPTSVVVWELGITLVIDNYRLLHRRPAVSGVSQRVLERTYIWST
jgi:hypothetical protein